jgi:hypothetical protein
MDLSNQRAQTMLRTRTDHLTKVVQTLYLVYIPPNEMGSPQTAHLCILPSQCPNLDPIALIILVIINTSLVVITLVLISYLVHLLRRALQPQIYPI